MRRAAGTLAAAGVVATLAGGGLAQAQEPTEPASTTTAPADAVVAGPTGPTGTTEPASGGGVTIVGGAPKPDRGGDDGRAERRRRARQIAKDAREADRERQEAKAKRKAKAEDKERKAPAPGDGAVAGGGLALPPGLEVGARVPNLLLEKFRIPPFLLPIYQAAGVQYGVRWEVLAAINEIETDYGRNLNVSSAGAQGWMQFMPATWAQWGVDANRDGRRDPYNPVDAIFAAARYLAAAGYAQDVRGAIFAYNHADWYVNSVLLRARLVETLPGPLVDALSGLTEGRFPVAAKATYASAVADARARVRAGSRALPVQGTATRRDLIIRARADAPVVAVQDGEVVRTGTSATLGHYVVLRDVWGNSYTYAGLGSVAPTYLAPKESKSDLKLRQEAADAGDPEPTIPATAGVQPADGATGDALAPGAMVGPQGTTAADAASTASASAGTAAGGDPATPAGAAAGAAGTASGAAAAAGAAPGSAAGAPGTPGSAAGSAAGAPDGAGAAAGAPDTPGAASGSAAAAAGTAGTAAGGPGTPGAAAGAPGSAGAAAGAPGAGAGSAATPGLVAPALSPVPGLAGAAGVPGGQPIRTPGAAGPRPAAQEPRVVDPSAPWVIGRLAAGSASAPAPAATSSPVAGLQGPSAITAPAQSDLRLNAVAAAAAGVTQPVPAGPTGRSVGRGGDDTLQHSRWTADELAAAQQAALRGALVAATGTTAPAGLGTTGTTAPADTAPSPAATSTTTPAAAAPSPAATGTTTPAATTPAPAGLAGPAGVPASPDPAAVASAPSPTAPAADDPATAPGSPPAGAPATTGSAPVAAGSPPAGAAGTLAAGVPATAGAASPSPGSPPASAAAASAPSAEGEGAGAGDRLPLPVPGGVGPSEAAGALAPSASTTLAPADGTANGSRDATDDTAVPLAPDATIPAGLGGPTAIPAPPAPDVPSAPLVPSALGALPVAAATPEPPAAPVTIAPDPVAAKLHAAEPLVPAVSATGGSPVTTYTPYARKVLNGLGRKHVESRPLKAGAQVVGGTVLGRMGAAPAAGEQAAMRFRIRPAGKGAPLIDPTPIVDGWRLLETSSVYRASGRSALTGGPLTIGRLLLQSKAQLARLVLESPDIAIYPCGRQDIQAGRIDRRVLATLAFLAASGLKPTVSALECGHSFLTSSGNVSEHSSGSAVDIAAINGIPILGHQGAGSITETTIRKLLTLQGVMKPHQIISLMTFPGTDNTLSLPDHDDHIHVGFHAGPTLGGPTRTVLKPAQWARFVAQLDGLELPEVAAAPSSASLPAEK